MGASAGPTGDKPLAISPPEAVHSQQNVGSHPTTDALRTENLTSSQHDSLVTIPFDQKKEFVEILVWGINHSIIHDLQGRVAPVCSYCDLLEYFPDFIPARFPVEVRDPRVQVEGQPSWNSLSSRDKITAFKQALLSYNEIRTLEADKNFPLEPAVKFFKRMEGVLESLCFVGEALPQAAKEGDFEPFVRNAKEGLMIVRAQLDFANPPARFPEVNVEQLLKDAATLQTEGRGRFPSEFIRVGEFVEGKNIYGQRDLLLRTIADLAKNAFQAGYNRESARIQAEGRDDKPKEVDIMRQYHVEVGTRLLASGELALYVRDNCGGMPQAYLAPDIKGVPERPYLCNRTTSSKGSGIGTCEFYHIAVAHGATLQVQNYSISLESRGAELLIVFPQSAIT